jgi:uracil DNA glycosylase
MSWAALRGFVLINALLVIEAPQAVKGKGAGWSAPIE